MAQAIATNQIINKYYDLYREDEVTFSKEILRSLRIDPRQIYVKCAGSQWPCIVNSTSFQMAKIIIGTSGGAFQAITKKDAPPVNLRFCFVEEDGQPLYFFISCKVTNVTPYMNSQELAIITLTFTQRPPDDFLLKLGTLIDANSSFVRRKDERILINDVNKKLLHIYKKESIIYVQNVPRRCVLWDISFTGTKIIIMGLPNFLKGKECVIRLLFEDPNEMIDVKGTIVQADPVEGRRDLVTAGIQFDINLVPLSFKVRINEYFAVNKKTLLNQAQNKQGEEQDPTKIFVQAKQAQEAQKLQAEKELEAAKTKALEAQKTNAQGLNAIGAKIPDSSQNQAQAVSTSVNAETAAQNQNAAQAAAANQANAINPANTANPAQNMQK